MIEHKRKMFTFSELKRILSIHSWIEDLKQEILYKLSWCFKLHRILVLLKFIDVKKRKSCITSNTYKTLMYNNNNNNKIVEPFLNKSIIPVNDFILKDKNMLSERESDY